MNQPNIFNCGTTELTQDAVIMWLLSWADEANKNNSMYKAGQSFIKSIIGDKYSQEIKKVKAWRQWKDIDVCLEINDDLFVIIENKKGSQIHDNQLNRYKQMSQNYYADTERTVIGVYIQSVIECSKHKADIKKSEYKYIGFNALKDMIEHCSQDQNNDILTDYRRHLEEHFQAHQGWDTQALPNGDSLLWHNCYGLYQYLEDKFGDGISPWDYAPNHSGGTQWLILNGTWSNLQVPDMDSSGIDTYLQLENDNKGFRLIVKNSCSIESRSKLKEFRYALLEYVKAKCWEAGFSRVEKAGKFKTGQSTSTAVIYLGGDNYVPLKEDQTIDKKLLVDQLKKASTLFHNLAQDSQYK